MSANQAALLIAASSTVIAAVMSVASIYLRAVTYHAAAAAEAGQHLKLRRRLWVIAPKKDEPTVVIKPGERPVLFGRCWRGWVWIVVKPTRPIRGRRPIECHREYVGWAWTHRAAARQAAAEVARPAPKILPDAA